LTKTADGKSQLNCPRHECVQIDYTFA
jgi:hypothetical protein